MTTKIAYATTYDAQTLNGVNEWAGTGYHIAKSLEAQSIAIDYVGPLQEKLCLKAVCKAKRHYHQLFQKRYLKDMEPLLLKDIANQVARKLSQTKPDLVFSATINSIAYLDCEQPIVFWADATFANMLDFYPLYSNLCEETIRNGHQMEQLSLQRCRLALYSSDWAAQTAIDHYKADPAKVKVVPFGANLEAGRTLSEVKNLIDSRPSATCKLLFLGVDWFRKGGNVAFDVAQMLNTLGLNTELVVIGGQPILEQEIPDFVKPLGFISKATRAGREKISDLIAESHFLILPSLADCTPIVFCEANSLGVPCISTNIGGIPTLIQDNLNGKLFDKNSDISEYCKYILRLFSNYSEYKSLALSAFYEYQHRLNWTVAGKTVRSLLENYVN